MAPAFAHLTFVEQDERPAQETLSLYDKRLSQHLLEPTIWHHNA